MYKESITINIKIIYYRQTRAVVAAAAAAAAVAFSASQTPSNDANCLPHESIYRDISTRRPRFSYSRRNAPIISHGFRKLQTFFSNYLIVLLYFFFFNFRCVFIGPGLDPDCVRVHPRSSLTMGFGKSNCFQPFFNSVVNQILLVIMECSLFF